MTREQAIRKLRSIYGAKAWWSVRNEITSPEKRAEAKAESERQAAEEKRLDSEIKRLMDEHGITELMRQRSAARLAATDARYRSGKIAGYRFEVGQSAGIGVEVKGYGDTWEEAIEDATKTAAVLAMSR